MAPRHAQTSSSSKKWWILGGASSVVLGLALTLLIVTTTSGSNVSTPTTSASQIAGSFSVVTTTPSDQSTVDSTATVRVALSQPLSPTSPLPSIVPTTSGTWQRLSPSTLEFVQDLPFAPGQSITVTVPGGEAGITSASGAKLAATVSSTFAVSGMSLTRVQQLLAEEGYLPLNFTPALSSVTPVGTADEFGSFSWRFANTPAQLSDLWTQGEMTTVTKGAIMRFQDVHHMTTDGSLSPALEAALLSDRYSGKSDPAPYTYVMVSRALPQTLNLYSNGQMVYTTRVNLGIPGEETPSGTWPVYLRYATTTMQGTNPDGSHYYDEGIPSTSYFTGGVALHGFIRPSYGTPQSLGCVEMPFDNAKIVWDQTPYGTLVYVD